MGKGVGKSKVKKNKAKALRKKLKFQSGRAAPGKNVVAMAVDARTSRERVFSLRVDDEQYRDTFRTVRQ